MVKRYALNLDLTISWLIRLIILLIEISILSIYIKVLLLQFLFNYSPLNLGIKNNKLVISPKVIKSKHKLINKLLKQGDLTQFDTVANNFNKVIQKFGRPIKFTNTPLTDDRRFHIADYKHKMLRFNYKYNRNSNDWKKHDEWNSATLELAILNSIKHKKAILLQLLRERKEAFIKKVNNLQTKTPYSFVFQREYNNASIESLCNNTFSSKN
ncbi:hypothetical protein ABK040_005367 [Willaertia magna]